MYTLCVHDYNNNFNYFTYYFRHSLLRLHACFAHCVLSLKLFLFGFLFNKGNDILIWVVVRCIEIPILSEITDSSLTGTDWVHP